MRTQDCFQSKFFGIQYNLYNMHPGVCQWRKYGIAKPSPPNNQKASKNIGITF